MLLINKIVIFVTCSNCVWFILVFIIFLTFIRIFLIAGLLIVYTRIIYEIKTCICIYDHVWLTTLSICFWVDFFMRGTTSIFFTLNPKIFMIIIFHRKKMVLYRSVDNCVVCIWKNEAKFIQLFVKAAVFSSKPSFMYNN